MGGFWETAVPAVGCARGVKSAPGPLQLTGLFQCLTPWLEGTLNGTRFAALSFGIRDCSGITKWQLYLSSDYGLKCTYCCFISTYPPAMPMFVNFATTAAVYHAV